MALEDYVRQTRELIQSLRDQAEASSASAKASLAEAKALEKNLKGFLGQKASIPPGVLTKEGRLLRPPTTTAKGADAIERLLEWGAKTMKRDDLAQFLVDNRLVGTENLSEIRLFQYADFAIDSGLKAKPPYLRQDSDGTIHWLPGQRKSRVSKRR